MGGVYRRTCLLLSFPSRFRALSIASRRYLGQGPLTDMSVFHKQTLGLFCVSGMPALYHYVPYVRIVLHAPIAGYITYVLYVPYAGFVLVFLFVLFVRIILFILIALFVLVVLCVPYVRFVPLWGYVRYVRYGRFPGDR